MESEVVAAIISAASGLAGAFLGAWISLLATKQLEEQRAEREKKLKLNERRFIAYSALLKAVHRINSLEDVEARHADRQGIAEWIGANQDIALVGSPRVADLAVRFEHIVNNTLLGYTSAEPAGSWFEARQELLSAIREELGSQTDSPNAAIEHARVR